MRSKNDKEKAARREALLNAAQNVFFDKGFVKTSMDDIASSAGFSRALLYVYFKDKKDIYQAIKIRAIEALHQRMINKVDINASGIEQVTATGMAYYEFYLQDTDYFNCLSLDISLSNQSGHNKKGQRKKMERSEQGIKIESAIMNIMVNALERGISDKTLDRIKIDNALETALFMRGSLHGIILMQENDGQYLLTKAGINTDKLIRNAITRMVSSIAA